MAAQPEKVSTSRLSVALIDLRSTYNVGNIARTALAFGIETIFTVGTTPQLERKEIAKVALGGEQIKHEQLNRFDDFITRVQKDYTLIALETGGQNIKEFDFATIKKPILLLLGNERFGLSEGQLIHCAYRVSIPHQKQTIQSLNVGNAFAIAASIIVG